MRSSSHPRGRTGGNSVVKWYETSSRVGNPSSWPCVIQSDSVNESRTGTYRVSSWRMNITRASSA
jgi:hypothetical protein